MWRAFSLLLFFVCIPVAALAAEPMGVVKGTIQTTSLCGTGTALMLAEQSTQLIIGTSTVVYGPAAGPVPGIVVFAVTVGTTTCTVPNTASTITGQRVSHIVYASTALPSTPGGGSGEGSGSGTGGQSLRDRIQSAAQQAQSYLQQFLNPTPPAAPSMAASPGIPFGGPITKILFCKNAAIYTLLGPPTPGPYVWMPGTISYPFGPPATVGQYLLGASGPGGVCLIGNTVLLGQRIIMHGSSGPIAPSAPEAPPQQAQQPSQISCGSGALNTPAQKVAAERKVREDLEKLGIGINRSNACALGQSYLQYQAKHCPQTKECGCTDVAGLQCDSLKYLERLRQICGKGFTVSGGSEAGHKTHGGGKAFDVTGIDECIKKNFKLIDAGKCIYQDPATGTTFRDETNCAVGNTTGGHFHICVGGVGCR